MRLLPILCAVFLLSCSEPAQPPLVAADIVVTRPLPGMAMSAAYLSLHNNSNAAITITRVTSPQFGAVEIHESTVADGVARMRALPALTIPAGGTVALERGGKHLMLMRPAGDVDSVSLEFFDGDTLILSVSATAQPPPR